MKKPSITRAQKHLIEISPPILTMIQGGAFDVRFTAYHCNFRINNAGFWRSAYWAWKMARLGDRGSNTK